MMIPKPIEGSIERIVLDKLIDSAGKGITIYDFPEYLNITADVLEQTIRNLEHNIFKSENDDLIKFDS